MPRYIIVDESVTAHSHFVASVVDTTRTTKGGNEYAVCECMDREDAETIARSLNESKE